jgi:F420-non-reducing hydrogenase iron-sulfur subunit
MQNSTVDVDQVLAPGAKGPHGAVVFRCAAAPSETASPGESVEPRLSAYEIRVPCAGKLQPEHFLKAFERGADLVLVAICRDGECRYLEGSLRVRRRVDYVKSILDDIGLGGRRIALVEMTHPEQDKDIAEALNAGLAGLEPSPLSISSEQEDG